MNGGAYDVWRRGVDDHEQDLGAHEQSLHSGNFLTVPGITQREDIIHASRVLIDSAATSDDQLMLAVRTGGGDAFQRLFGRYREPVWRFFRRRVRDADHAEELAQDVFAALLEAAPRYEARGAFRSYLFGIAYNILLADRRKPGRNTEPLDEALAAAPVADPDAGIWVRRALAQLDGEDREILLLREYEQLSYQEIADLRSLPLNTVRSKLFRARMALRQALLPPARAEEKGK